MIHDQVLTDITILYTGADSLLNKRHELVQLVNDTKPLIIGIAEVKPKNCVTPLQESELNLNEFECYSSLFGRRGVLLYIHKSMEALEITSEKEQYKDSIWCIVILNKNDKLLVGCVYRSPSSTADEDECLNRVIREASEYKASHKLIIGDFNHPEIDWHIQT